MRGGDPDILAAGHYWAARPSWRGPSPTRCSRGCGLRRIMARPSTASSRAQALGLKQLPPHEQDGLTCELGAAVGYAERSAPPRRCPRSASASARPSCSGTRRRSAGRRITAVSPHLAARLNLPETQLYLAHNGPAGAKAGRVRRATRRPNWSPNGGWRVDKALVYAHALQESRFRADAISPAGAHGVMQVLPGTAQLIAKPPWRADARPVVAARSSDQPRLRSGAAGTGARLRPHRRPAAQGHHGL